MGADDYSAGRAARSAKKLARAAQRDAALPDDPWAALLARSEGDLERRVGSVLHRILALGAGWVRLVPSADGVVYIKFRYVGGRWDGYYSLTSFRPVGANLADALEALERLILGALAPVATHKPSPDRY